MNDRNQTVMNEWQGRLPATASTAEATSEYIIIITDNDLSWLTLNLRQRTACHHPLLMPLRYKHIFKTSLPALAWSRAMLRVLRDSWCARRFTNRLPTGGHHWNTANLFNMKKISQDFSYFAIWNIIIPKAFCWSMMAFSGGDSHTVKSLGIWNLLLDLH